MNNLNTSSEEDAHILSYAQRLYDDSLSKVLPLLETKNLYRVFLHETGYVLSVKHVRATSRAVNGSFLLKCQGKGCVPRFGNYNRLNQWQINIANVMVQDIAKIITTCSVANLAIGSPTKDKTLAKKTLADLEERFGKMPDTGILDAIHEGEKRQVEKEQKQQMKKEVWGSISENCFEDFLAKEKARMQTERNGSISA